MTLNANTLFLQRPIRIFVSATSLTFYKVAASALLFLLTLSACESGTASDSRTNFGKADVYCPEDDPTMCSDWCGPDGPCEYRDTIGGADFGGANSYAASKTTGDVYLIRGSNILKRNAKIAWISSPIQDNFTETFATSVSNPYDVMLDEKQNRLLFLSNEWSGSTRHVSLWEMDLSTKIDTRLGLLRANWILPDDANRIYPSQVLAAKFDPVSRRVIAFAYLQNKTAHDDWPELGSFDLLAFEPDTQQGIRLTTDLVSPYANTEDVQWHFYPEARLVSIVYNQWYQTRVNLDTLHIVSGQTKGPITHYGRYRVLAYRPSVDRYYASYIKLPRGYFRSFRSDGSDEQAILPELEPYAEYDYRNLPERLMIDKPWEKPWLEAEPVDPPWSYNEELDWVVSLTGHALDFKTMQMTRLF